MCVCVCVCACVRACVCVCGEREKTRHGSKREAFQALEKARHGPRENFTGPREKHSRP